MFGGLLLGGGSPAPAARDVPRRGKSASSPQSLLPSALWITRGNDGRPFAAPSPVGSLPPPLRLSLQLPGLLGGKTATRIEWGRALLPDFQALRAGSRGVYGQAAGSQRLEFNAERLTLASQATLGAHWLRLSGRHGGGQRLALSLDSGRLRLEGLLQELDARVRPGLDLAAGDRKLFGNEAGIRRTALSLGYETGPGKAVSFAQTRLDANGARAERRRLAFDGGEALSLALEMGQVDRGFDRASRLSGIEKTLFSRERGFRWQELAARFRLADWGALEGTRYRSRGEDGERQRQRARTQLTLTPGPGTRLLLREDRNEQQSRPGQAHTTTTRTLQWEQTLGSATKLRALRETSEREDGEQSRAQTRQLWELRAGRGSGWKLQGMFGRTDAEGAPNEKSFQTSLSGTLGKGWQLSAAATERARDDAQRVRKRALTLAGSEGVLGGLLPRTGLSLALASAEGIPMAVVPSGKRAAETGTSSRSAGWQSLSLLARTNLGKSLLTLGVQSFALPGGSAGGLAYWWRSTGKDPLQWELRRTWLELAAGKLVPRERMALSYQWDGHRLAVSTELNPEHVPGKPALGLRESTLDLQTRIGTATLGVTYGTIADLAKGHESQLRRLALETPLSHQGSLRFIYEDNDTPHPTRSIPNELLALAARQKVAADHYFDLQLEARRWDGSQIADELTWRIDLFFRF